MARITEDNFSALKQNRMVVGGECRADVIEFGAFTLSKARVSGRQTSEQRDKSRTEKK